MVLGWSIIYKPGRPLPPSYAKAHVSWVLAYSFILVEYILQMLFEKVNMSQKAVFVRPQSVSAVLFDCFFEVPGASSS